MLRQGVYAPSQSSETLKIELGTDEPVKIAWEDENMSVMYLLAPRVSDDWDGA